MCEKKYTATEAAQKLNISKSSIITWAKDGKIPYEIICVIKQKRMIFKKSDIEDFGSTIVGATLSTGDLARDLDVSYQKLSYWIRKGWITPDWTSPGGWHRWTPANLAKIKTKLKLLNVDR